MTDTNEEQTISLETKLQKAPGLQNLAKGYLSYAEEVILRRALPDLYDGMKPVNRFIIYVAKKNKADKNITKSLNLVGNVAPYHPHGDSAIYDAMVRMVDSNGTLLVPYFKGDSSFGNSYSKDTPAASRYTSVKLSPVVEELFTAPDGVPMVQTEDDHLTYPQHLSVSFPNVLTNENNGMAVAIGTEIPSYNPKDVINLVDEYIETGKLNTLIVPDFSSGGQIVNDTKELSRIMATGKGTLKLRATTRIDGKQIIVDELPFGVTVEKVIAEIHKGFDNGDLEYVRDNPSDFSDLKNGLKLVITATSKDKVEDALLELYHKTSLQIRYHSNMMFVQDDKPVSLGVNNVIRNWVAWRRKVIRKQATVNMQSMRVEKDRLETFLKLLDNRDDIDFIMQSILDNEQAKAEQLLRDKYTDSTDVIDWILHRTINQFNRAGKYTKRYEELQQDYKYWGTVSKSPDTMIKEDIKRLRNRPDLNFDRKTQITNVDYQFVKVEASEATAEPAWYEITDGFIKKLDALPYNTKPNSFVLEGLSNDVILNIDAEGHILRVYGEDLEWNLQTDRGTYIPRYCGFSEDMFIYWSGLAKENQAFLEIYRTGYTGYLDTTPYTHEHINQRSRVQIKGVHPATNELLDILPYRPDDYLVMEEETTRTTKLGIIKIGDIKRRGQTARTKVMDLKEVSRWQIVTKEELDLHAFPIEEYLVTENDKKMHNYEGDFWFENEVGW